MFVVERLACLSPGDWSAFLQQVCAVLESVEKAGSGATTGLRTKLNLLCYLCCVCGHRDTATRFMHSPLVSTVWVHITHAVFFFYPKPLAIKTESSQMFKQVPVTELENNGRKKSH